MSDHNGVTRDLAPLPLSPQRVFRLREAGADEIPSQDSQLTFGRRLSSALLRLNSFTSSSTVGIEAFASVAVSDSDGLNEDSPSGTTNALQSSDPHIHPRTPTPLPMRVMTALSFVIFCEPLSLTILFPFIYFMVRDFGLSSDKEVGFYVGFIASAFSLAQFLTSLGWGWISDRTGRRPVLLIGLLGNAVSLILFGQSHSLQMAIASRALCGMLNGNVGIAKCVIGEVTDSTNQSTGFSIINVMWSLGTIFGPAIGGVLANPVETYPSVFGECVFLRRHPYFLPCFVSALISFVGFVVAALFLPETNPAFVKHGVEPQSEASEIEEFSRPGEASNYPSNITPAPKIHRKSLRSIISTTSMHESIGSSTRASSSTAFDVEDRSDISERTTLLGTQSETRLSIGKPSALAITGYTMLAFENIILDEVFNLWVVTPREDGGLGYSSADVGISLSLVSFLALYFQLATYPSLTRYASPLQLYRIGALIYVIPYIGYPIISGVLAPVLPSRLTYAALLLNLTILQFSNILCFTSIFIVINNSAPRGTLGTVTGVAQTCAAFVRSIGPALGGILWAWSITNAKGFPFNYWFVFLCIAAVGVITHLQSFLIPELANGQHDGHEEGQGSH
ncbi:major facilitator superfamily domain-containing protein [Chytriomyces sp. MP71]|nr:major facilitator superfamily domain-containing protein [Chytriomyces sp. MP71]